MPLFRGVHAFKITVASTFYIIPKHALKVDHLQLFANGARASPTDNQGVIVISSMCLGEACFLFSQICRGLAPSSP